MSMDEHGAFFGFNDENWRQRWNEPEPNHERTKDYDALRIKQVGNIGISTMNAEHVGIEAWHMMEICVWTTQKVGIVFWPRKMGI